MSWEALLQGRRLGGRYRVLDPIGRGGMGAVYRAVDERLGRLVAVKILAVPALDPEARARVRARFLREARAAAALPHHPNVVTVFDYGTDEELGLDYLVMELLHGQDLARVLARAAPLPLPTGLWILREAARGVAVGHRAGLVHRDVKPGNIFLARAGDDDIQVKVLDFGIVKAIEEDTWGQLTQEGRAPLSPLYAAPEQLRGLERITPAADVFALGVVGVQMLTGRRPYDDAARNRMALGEAVPPPPLSELPGEVRAVLHRALDPDPARRYPDAGALARDLDAVLRAFPEIPPPPVADERPPAPLPVWEATAPAPAAPDDATLLAPGAAPPARAAPSAPATPTRRRRLATWAGPLALLLSLGAAAAWYFGWRPAERPSPPAGPPPDTAADTLTLPTDAPTANLEGRRRYLAGDYAAALEFFRRAVELDPTNLEYRNNYALALLRTGNAAAAERELEAILRQDPNRARAYANLADARLALGDTAGAIAAFQRFLLVSQNPRERAVVERRLQELQRVPELVRPSQPPQPIDTLLRAPRRDTAPSPPPTPPDTARAKPPSATPARPAPPPPPPPNGRR